MAAQSRNNIIYKHQHYGWKIIRTRRLPSRGNFAGGCWRWYDDEDVAVMLRCCYLRRWFKVKLCCRSWCLLRASTLLFDCHIWISTIWTDGDEFACIWMSDCCSAIAFWIGARAETWRSVVESLRCRDCFRSFLFQISLLLLFWFLGFFLDALWTKARSWCRYCFLLHLLLPVK